MGTNGSKDERWQRDSEAPSCHSCAVNFSISTRRHHCRNCGYVFCGNCSNFSCSIPMRGIHVPVRVCADCFHALRRDFDGALVGGGFRQCGGPVPPVTSDGNEAGALEQESHLNMNKALNGNFDYESSYFMGSGGGGGVTSNAYGNLREFDGYYGNDARSAEHLIHNHLETDKRASQLERELLLKRWGEVRQRAVFTDILLQQVEIVEENTEVEYFREIADIKVQPEHPDLLAAMFPFPEAAEGNADLLMEAIHLRIPGPPEGYELVKHALEKRAARLLSPPAA
ncbi:putative zinc finger protein [Trypanosoma cruzi]|uniref:Zinc finger protein, putative n=2 Tax=Trypanosoma cruzi TaxID=5693 RepID=Q4DUA9_TRYCC|nr:zinc finger protein, putative [Trypanosoma cruzi]EAN96101.1 zinc finger protein, putative [Trypanosoma cruzi]PWV21990.1 putative zinc finger protein [Trypanosoma cruzi]RNC62009.1 zinc finger protein [Trypanosoma cruzi]|eukprot:XP_817952.1 zinc finger protein [Trypanosoma cruzi strain CL Brener]